MKKSIMLVNDLPGVGKVALGAMIPILSYMGYSVHNLPTALVSNTLDYGDFQIEDNTKYMAQTVQVWKRLGFTVDALATGFITSKEQIPIIQELMELSRKEEPLIMVDPIMGDHGSLYNGLSEDLIPLMQEMAKSADLILPNLTEAYLLTGRKPKNIIDNKEELKEIGNDLLDLGSKSFLITSVKTGWEDLIYGYNHLDREFFEIPYQHIPVNFPGTGDVFSAVLLGTILKGKSLQEGTKHAANFIYTAILDNQAYTKDTREGLFIENHLSKLQEGRNKE